ncbi:hypothetical protein DS832_06240 [Bombilactobacillus bombi]|uniref:Uncharacterized protein n=1 Tax=Bombilactobacillus bombi TaxID=1303590 RepID=A0A417Z6U5_9LACO|nr:hypothetical protein [Bombilactobacillus bombi]RHW46351.1 hypothetical protein DS832_06240 [Bombilactobacillus bombi]
MHKKTLAIIISMLLLCLGTETSLVAAKTNQYNHDYIVVYNAQNQKITTITSKKSINYLSDFADDVGGNEKGIHKKLTNNAQLSYKYVFHSGKKSKLSYKLNLYVYPNVKEVKLTNLPIVSNGVWQIDKKQLHKLDNPKKFNNN